MIDQMLSMRQSYQDVRSHPRVTVIPLLILMIISSLSMIAFDRPLVRGDGLAYLVWVDTLILDQDIDLNNQHDRFRQVNTYQIQWSVEQNRWVNIFPFGIAFVQAPFYITGHVFYQNGWLNLNPEYFRQMQGVGLPYSLWLMVGANVLMLLAIAMAWNISTRCCDQWTAALVVFAVFVGTPIFYYSTISPVNSHNPGGFAVACLLYSLIHCRDAGSKNIWWVSLGAAAGIAVLCRWQLALVAVPVWGLLIWERRWKGFIIASGVALLALAPLPLIWNAMFGSPFVVPYDTVSGQSFLKLHNFTPDVLLELVIHSPVVLISLLGMPALWRLDKRLCVVVGSMLLLQLLINGAALDWYAGDSYGMRRMSELYIVYALLVFALIKWLVAQKRWLLPVVRGGMVLLILYSFIYIVAYLDFTWTNPEQAFIARPDVMIRYFLGQPHKLEVLWEVYRTHVGPFAWTMPGP